MSAKPILDKQMDAWETELGHRIRARRLECGLSQTKLAEQLGLSFQQVQKYETGKNSISAARLRLIGGFLQVPMTFFYGSDETTQLGQPRFRPTRLFDLLADRETLELVAAFSLVSGRTFRRELIRLVEKIARTKNAPRKRTTRKRVRTGAGS